MQYDTLKQRPWVGTTTDGKTSKKKNGKPQHQPSMYTHGTCHW